MGALLRRAAIGFLLLETAAMGAGATNRVAAAAVPECGTSVLRATIGGQSAGVGNLYTTLVLLNAGPGSCYVQGYPGISLVDRRGRQIGRAATRVKAIARPIVLRSGQTASTVIHTLNPGVGTTNCLGRSTALRVYPPDQRGSLLVRAHLSECLGVLEVRPLIAGSSGM